MNEKDAPSDDEGQSEGHPKREPENPAERQRSFMRQRAAILRPHDDPGAEANTQPSTKQEDAEDEQDNAAAAPRKHDERRKLLAQYRRRQREK
ncbi:MAG TPA: hypothetical protein VF735_01975 [Pyrinomonadaceae bacterium]|jgi:hypothetical protein